MKALNLVWAVSSVLMPLCAQADLMGKTVSVADGDTITILDASMTQHKVRLAQIDARGCKNFCVNGYLAGNCRIARSDDDRSEESRTQGIAGQPVG